MTHIFFIESVRLTLFYYHDYQLLPLFMEITSFICSNRIEPLCLGPSSGRLEIVVKGSFNLNLLMLIKQGILSPLRNLVILTFGILLIVFSAKVRLLSCSCGKKLFSALDNRDCSLKCFLKTFILETQRALYLLSILGLN